jgi:hypothetical protein
MAALLHDRDSVPRAFLSHSSRDKPLARRIARRLSHRGVTVWLDEEEMQIGDRLSERLASEIRRSSHFLVLLTNASCASKWVEKEIEVARSVSDPAIPIVPLIAEENLRKTPLDESLGISITDPWAFEDVLGALARTILGHMPSDDRDPILLKRDLRAISIESPQVRGLIEQLINEGRITIAQLEATTITEDLRHPIETALIALHECVGAKARYVVSLAASRFFRQRGVGYEVLRRQILIEPESSDELSTMFSALGGYLTRPADIDGAFRLFEMAKPPKDQAFWAFVEANFGAFTIEQQNRAVRFITTPDRGPAGFAIEAAFSLFSRLPHDKSLHALWWFWVNDYKFGGRPEVEGSQNGQIFFELMNEADKRNLLQFDAIMQHFETCIRGLARSRKLEEVLGAVKIVITATESRYVRRNGLARQLEDAVHSAEWNEFKHGNRLRLPILHLAQDAANDRSYSESLRALSAAIKSISGSA